MKLTINLSTRTYLNRRALFSWYAFLGSVLLMLLGFFLWSGYLSYNQHQQLDLHLKEIQARIETLQKADLDYSPEKSDQLQQRIVLANELLVRDSFRWTELLGRLEEVVPDEASVQTITPDYKDRSLKLLGVTTDVASLREFLDNLMESSYFSDVYLLSQDTVAPAGEQGEGSTLTRYSIVLKGAF